MTDQAYWDHFYEQPHPDLEAPSSFARVCRSLLASGDSVFEIGCGNGRDAIYMARGGLRVFASDPSHAALAEVRARVAHESLLHPPRLVAHSMDELDDRHARDLDAIYARFVFHAVTADVATAGLSWAARNLRPGGRLLLEVRSVLGSLYGQGRPAGRDAFIHDGHFRRFIRADELRTEIGGLGFQIDELVEEDGLAIRDGDDPVVIRVFATLGSPGGS